MNERAYFTQFAGDLPTDILPVADAAALLLDVRDMLMAALGYAPEGLEQALWEAIAPFVDADAATERESGMAA